MVVGTKEKTRQKPAAPRRIGRPLKTETANIRGKMLDVAAVFFFEEGYGATSIEAIARHARISKRTIYHRFKDKAALFQAVVHRVIERARPHDVDHLFEGQSIDAILRGLARVILRASLSKEALALHRVILAEATRFPELALIVNEQGTRREAVQRIAALLEKQNGSRSRNMEFAAEQFLQMVIASPQRRALGLGQPMSPTELDAWADKTVDLFLKGFQG